MSDAIKPRVIFVGAFPKTGSAVFGGNVSDCRALLASSFADELSLFLIDSSQESVPAPSIGRRAQLAFPRIVKFLHTFHTERPDALLVFASSGLSFVEKALLVAYARLFGVPSLLSIRSGHFMDRCRDSRWFREVAHLLLRAPAYIPCQGKAWQQFYSETFAFSNERCPIVESWVARPELLDLDHIANSPRVNVLFLGWLETFKGLYELIEAASILANDPEVPEFRVTIAGTGSQEANASTLVESLNLAHIVSFPGFISGDVLLRALAEADVFVLPSHTEGLPNSMIEAMSAGLAVVVTTVGSIPDVIADGVNGLLVPPADAPRLAAALRRLLMSSDLRKSLGQGARQTASSRFGPEQAARSLVALIKRSGARVTR